LEDRRWIERHPRSHAAAWGRRWRRLFWKLNRYVGVDRFWSWAGLSPGPVLGGGLVSGLPLFFFCFSSFLFIFQFSVCISNTNLLFDFAGF
jgi:hypothetical protein